MNESIATQLLEKLEEIQRSLGMMAVPNATDNYPINEWASNLFHSCTDVIMEAHKELDTHSKDIERRFNTISNVKGIRHTAPVV